MPTITPAVLAGGLAAATHPLSEPYKTATRGPGWQQFGNSHSVRRSDVAAKARTLDDVNTLRSICLGRIPARRRLGISSSALRWELPVRSREIRDKPSRISGATGLIRRGRSHKSRLRPDGRRH
jgi:hypothetical protein